MVIVNTTFLVIQSRRASKAVQDEFAEEMPDTASRWDAHWSVQALPDIGGLALLVLGADWLVDAAVAVARIFGVSALVIGLTVVTVGTLLSYVLPLTVITLIVGFIHGGGKLLLPTN